MIKIFNVLKFKDLWNIIELYSKGVYAQKISLNKIIIMIV